MLTTILLALPHDFQKVHKYTTNIFPFGFQFRIGI